MKRYHPCDSIKSATQALRDISALRMVGSPSPDWDVRFATTSVLPLIVHFSVSNMEALLRHIPPAFSRREALVHQLYPLGEIAVTRGHATIHRKAGHGLVFEW